MSAIARETLRWLEAIRKDMLVLDTLHDQPTRDDSYTKAKIALEKAVFGSGFRIDTFNGYHYLEPIADEDLKYYGGSGV